MYKLIFFIALFTLTSLCFAKQTSVLTEASIPPQFVAIYDVHKSGMRVGEMQVNLMKTGNDLIYTSITNPVGLAAIFLGGQQFTDYAKLEFSDYGYRTIEFKHEMKGSKKNRNEHYVFDWHNKKVVGTYKDRKVQLELSPYTFDSFSSQLLLMREPIKDTSDYIFNVLSKGRLKEYAYKLETTEEMKTQVGALMAHKYIRKKHDKEDTTYIGWYAEKLNYIPVQLDKFENGKIDISIKIKKVTWL